MTLEERTKLMREIFEAEIIPLNQAKGHDYAGEADCLSNLADFGWQGVVVRIGDKYHRIKNFVKHKKLKVTDEDIEQTFKDMINYAFFALIMYRSKHKQINECCSKLDKLMKHFRLKT